ncbi:MAG: GntR family transcriptional regulator [Bacillota bacterium]
MKEIINKMNINKDSVIPIYYQIKEQLYKFINKDVLEDGDLLPSENELSKHFDISRMTARNALEELVKQGVVKRERGKGTIVVNPKIDQSLMQIKSFTKAMHEKGFTTRSDILNFEVGKASEEIQKKLKLHNNKIIMLSRLRWINDYPVGIQESYLPYDKAKNLIEHKEELKTESLYTLLKKYCSLQPKITHETLEIKKAGTKENKLLQIGLNEALFYVEAIVDCVSGPMEYVEAYYRSDFFKFHIKSQL